MREIKFRGRDRELFLWRYGDLDTKSSPDLVSIIDDCDYAVDPNTVGQYTGLKDSDGKGIYEGDVVEFNEEWHDFNGNYCIDTLRGYIKYDSGEFVIATLKHGESVMCLLSTYVQGGALIVIGNIYDNPDLLEATE